MSRGSEEEIIQALLTFSVNRNQREIEMSCMGISKKNETKHTSSPTCLRLKNFETRRLLLNGTAESKNPSKSKELQDV